MSEEFYEYYNSHYDSPLFDDDYWGMERKDIPQELYDVCIDGICNPLINEFGNHIQNFYYEYDREFRVELYIDEDRYDDFKEEWEEKYEENCTPQNMLERMGETLEREYPFIRFKFKKVKPYYDWVQFAFVGHCREQIFIYSKYKDWFVLKSKKEKIFFTDEKELKKHIRTHYPKHYKNYIWV